MRYKPPPQGDLSGLLEETVLAYYWIGFLMADGSINHATKRLKLTLATDYAVHVVRFADFIKCPNCRPEKASAYSVAIQDRCFVPRIIEKYGFKPKKKHNPPDLSYLTGDFFVSFLIGFIDGDGRVCKQHRRDDAVVCVKMHKSWLSVLDAFSVKIHDMCGLEPPRAKLNATGYARVHFANSVVLRFLKCRVIEWGLPVLERKWRLINENFLGKVEVAKVRREKIRELHRNGVRAKDIASLLGVSKSCVSITLKKLKKEGGV